MYNSDLIIGIAEKHTSERVRAVIAFENVLNNSVYKIETESRAYIFKIYRSGWPENGKLLFVSRKLTEYKIPHAHIYTFNREDKNFPNGYLIEECLQGTTADRLALSDGEMLELFGKLGDLVSRVHSIEMNGYGYIGDGSDADYTSFSEFMYDVLNDNAETLTSRGLIGAAELAELNEKICSRLKICDTLPSVLCHGDLSAKNVLVNAGEITLIDWDDAHALCWVADVARFTFCLKLNHEKDFAAACRKAFLDRYKTARGKEIFFQTEDILHVWYGLDNLTFFTEGDMCARVQALLREAREKCGLK